jgi:hypothetical protein
MKRLVFYFFAGLCFTANIFAQSLFEDAGSESEKDKQNKTGIQLNGFVRGSVFGGGEVYDLTTTFAELSLQGMFESGKAFVKSDLRFRKGVAFNEDMPLLVLKELYAGYRGNQFDVLLGNQIVSWGRTDGFNPTDNITPRDYFFLTADPDDQKTPNFLLRLKYRIIPEIELDVIGAPFYTASNYRYSLFDMGSQVYFADDILPSKDIKNGTLAARLNFDFPFAGWSFSYFRGYDPFHGYDMIAVDWSTGSPVITNASKTYLKTSWGTDAAIPLGSLILRGEAAYNITDNPGNAIYIPLSDFSYVGAIETGFSGFTVIGQYIGKFTPDFYELMMPVLTDPLSPLAQMQYANAMIDYENRMFNRRIFNQQDKTNHAVALTVSKSFGYEAWQAEFTGYYNLTSEEWMIRPKISWMINDALSVSFGGNYMVGNEKTLFGYSSTIMNGAFVQMKVSF